jgi:uncharacterized phage protein (TIGR01671 family)
MRIIKFRVWDIKEKEFGSDILVSLVLDAYLATADKKDLKDSFDKYNGKNYILQQFTGLLDKNGKEIYEGDIIIFMGRWDKEGKVLEPNYLPYEVVWFMGGLRAIRDIGARSFFQHGENVGVGHTDSEILGNIFENPELLNK